MQIVICEKCSNVVEQNDGTTIHVERKGQEMSYTYHNRHSTDCLAQVIASMKARYQSSQSLPGERKALSGGP